MQVELTIKYLKLVVCALKLYLQMSGFADAPKSTCYISVAYTLWTKTPEMV